MEEIHRKGHALEGKNIGLAGHSETRMSMMMSRKNLARKMENECFHSAASHGSKYPLLAGKLMPDTDDWTDPVISVR